MNLSLIAGKTITAAGTRNCEELNAAEGMETVVQVPLIRQGLGVHG
jgi:hypothetical protein